MRCVYKVKSLLVLRILWTGSEDSQRRRMHLSALPVLCSLLPSRADILADGLGDTYVGIAAEMDFWVSPWKKRNLFAGFIFLGWFIWQGPILYIILEFENLFYLQRSLLKKQRKNKREAMYATPMRCFLNSELCLFTLFSDLRLHKQQNRGWAELHPIRWESDLH